MAIPDAQYSFDMNAAQQAANRWGERSKQHSKFEEAVRKKQYSKLDTAERRAARANRLLRSIDNTAPQLTTAMIGPYESCIERATGTPEVTAESISDAFLERIIGQTRDFQYVSFLEQALYVAKSVARVVTKLGGGRIGYGTGFMVSPSLLITNHHVLPSSDLASQSTVEFNFQRDRLGKDLPVLTLNLEPESFFLNDQSLDFALVAVAPSQELRAYGWCPLIKEPGKIVAGESINIVQHPKGETKQVVIRENRLIDGLDGEDLFYHYEADTEPGSSGSPVFNDQWEVVALHHSGIPKKNNTGDLIGTDGKVWRKGDDPSRLEWVANEGVRISKLVEFISKASVPTAAMPLMKELLDAKRPEVDEGITVREPKPVSPNPPVIRDDVDYPYVADNHGRITMTIPLQITVSLGNLAVPQTANFRTQSPLIRTDEAATSVVKPDPDDPTYAHRPGYVVDFLGFTVPFPSLTNATRLKAYQFKDANGVKTFELKYHHYSVLFNKDRQLAFVAGVNFDPIAPVQLSRESKDKWYYDPRVTPKELQAGEDLYADNPLDRGHLVRRADSAWGETEEEAQLGNDDTFHFTNCSPQHEITNQGKTQSAPAGLKLWGQLEKHVATQGKKNQRKLSIFNGPVFRNSDRVYRGVKLPKEFWKIIAFANDSGKPSVAAFVLSQAELIADLKEEFEVGEYKTVQVRIKDLESRTGLDFGPFDGWDVMEKPEATESFTGDTAMIVVNSLDDIVL